MEWPQVLENFCPFLVKAYALYTFGLLAGINLVSRFHFMEKANIFRIIKVYKFTSLFINIENFTNETW